MFLMLPGLPVNLPDAMFGNMVTIRPYTRLIRNKIGDIEKRIKEKRRQRTAKRLRANVLDVPYNPNMPVFIICRDRLRPLLELVEWLEDEGLKNIIFVDNASTYAPLVSYLDKTPYEVVRLANNVGHTSPWSQGIVSLYAPNQPFIVTDPDVIPDKGAHGAVNLFCKLLTEHPERTKVGFGLKIDDIPESYDLKTHVVAWESQFWETTVESDVYDAEIDTTFAVYRHNTPYTLGPALRTGGRFIARHEPWYTNSKHVNEETRYYREHADHTIGSWGVHEKDYFSKVYSRKTSRKVS